MIPGDERVPERDERPAQVDRGHRADDPPAVAVDQSDAAAPLEDQRTPVAAVAQRTQPRSDRIGLGLEHHAVSEPSQQRDLHGGAQGLADVPGGVLHDDGHLDRGEQSLVVSSYLLLLGARGERRDGHQRRRPGLLRPAGQRACSRRTLRSDARDHGPALGGGDHGAGDGDALVVAEPEILGDHGDGQPIDAVLKSPLHLMRERPEIDAVVGAEGRLNDRQHATKLFVHRCLLRLSAKVPGGVGRALRPGAPESPELTTAGDAGCCNVTGMGRRRR